MNANTSKRSNSITITVTGGTAAERKALVARLTADAPAKTRKASAPKAKAPKKAKAPAPAWIVDAAIARDGNKALAAAMREVGVAPAGDAWALAKSLIARGDTIAEVTDFLASAV